MAGTIITVKGARSNARVYTTLTKRFRSKTQRAIRHAWFGLADDLKKEANRAILSKRKTGRVYFLRSRNINGRRTPINPPKRHRASAPGETHANESGTLRKSIGWAVHGFDTMEFGYGVPDGDAPDHASFVEDGTSRMDPRPSLANAIERTQGNAQGHFARAMFREFGR